MQSQKWQNDLSFQGKPFNITVIQVHGQISNAEAEAEAEWFYEDLQDLLELIPPKICSFHYRGLEYKSKKSRDTWSIRQVWPWCSKWSREKANRDLPREHTGYSKQPLSTTQRMTLHMDITRQSIPKADWLCSQSWRSSIQAAKVRPGGDCGSDHEVLIAKLRHH